MIHPNKQKGGVDLKALTKNIQLYYSYTVFANLLILGPIITLYYLARDLSYTQILSLQAISAITIVLLEVPTGAVADLLGRKKSILLGASTMALSIFLYGLGTNFLVFAMAEILFAVGASFKSGADTALLYDSLLKLNRESEFKDVISRGSFYALLAQVPGSIVSSILFERSIALPLFISAGFIVISFLIALRFQEIEVYEKHERPKYLTQITKSTRTLVTHPKIRSIVFFCMIYMLFSRAGFWMTQPYLKAVHLPIRYFGLLFAGLNLIAAFSSRWTPQYLKFSKGWSLIGLMGILLISFLGLWRLQTGLGILFLSLQQVARGLYRPTTQKYINKHIPSKERATVLSLQSMLQNLTIAILFPMIGAMMDQTDIFQVHGYLLLALLLAGMIVKTVLKHGMSTPSGS
jgi:MFS family permease